ncbi:hypothetical protein GCM10010399_79870 [Dactylosporangium fulvum]|uniref:Uncharacterized protein n=1 Tax=Dactylosporangium fulvum TaxID=53359 RepID=A0ABY5W2V8_9ACTN|nr:hypothetical protein [Dactylosporangium fulvum]UWP83676.1 hypothetical protein Dfulv_05240 [Dactylosporangium fulvum]
MNHDVEERLRDVLQRHADDAPAGLAMLAAVETESTRRRRRRLVVASTAAAILVAAVPFTRARDATPSAVSAPPQTQQTLVDSTVPATVTFPFTPPTSDGYSDPTVWRAAGLPTLRQQLDGGDGAMATLTVSPTRPQLPPGTTATSGPATVRGHAGTLIDWTWDDVNAGPQRSLVWQEDASTWVELRTEPRAVAPDRLLAYAEALRADPLAAPAPFTFTLMPAGYTVDNITPGVVTFCPPGVPAGHAFTDKIAVMLDAVEAGSPPSGTAVRVGSRSGSLVKTAEATTLQVRLDNGRSLVIQSGGAATLSDADLFRFAAGITPTSAAEPGRG